MSVILLTRSLDDWVFAHQAARICQLYESIMHDDGVGSCLDERISGCLFVFATGFIHEKKKCFAL